MSQEKINHLHDLIRAAGLDAAIINPGPTLTYLTGLEFHLMERPIVLLMKPGERSVLVVPRLEKLKADSAKIDLEIQTYPDDPSQWQTVFDHVCHALKLSGQRIGAESTQLRLLEMRYINQGAPAAEIVPAEEIFSRLRERKTSTEVERMQKAVQIAESAFLKTLEKIRRGMSEQEVASELTIQLYRGGSDIGLPFNPIIAAGANGANPHAVAGERTIRDGDLIVIDWGASYQGYISDLTRMVAVGRIHPELEKIHQIVVNANQAGRNACQPGTAAGEVDRATRDVIVKAGYGDQFTHRTGHGIGMEAHEAPYIHTGNATQLLPGMTFTIEPGIYLEKLGGVRIEDNIVVTEVGREDLSTLSRDLFTI